MLEIASPHTGFLLKSKRVKLLNHLTLRCYCFEYQLESLGDFLVPDGKCTRHRGKADAF